MAEKRGPKPKVNKREFEKLCALQCTLNEFCCYFDCNETTIERFCHAEYGMKFAEIFRIKRGTGQISLRRTQFQLAEKNAAMAIFLGKQYLGQRDSFPEEQQDSKALEALIKAVEKI